MLQIAKEFGASLDGDDFDRTRKTLSEDCEYRIGTEVLIGPEEIIASYEGNMLEGRKKLDKLEWGKSRIELIDNSRYFVHFTDFLTHKGLEYTHKCKQRLIFRGSKIVRIEHIHDVEEQCRLDEFYRKVGLK